MHYNLTPYNLALPVGQLRFAIYPERFEDCCAHADECQRLADCYPALKQDCEGLAHQWRELANQGEHCQI